MVSPCKSQHIPTGYSPSAQGDGNGLRVRPGDRLLASSGRVVGFTCCL
jgi:hypothetical protein